MPPKQRKTRDKVIAMQQRGRPPTSRQAEINAKLAAATTPHSQLPPRDPNQRTFIGGGVQSLQNRIRTLEREIQSGQAANVPSIRRHFRQIISDDRRQIEAITRASEVPYWDDQFQWKSTWTSRFPPPPPPPSGGVVG